MDIPVLIYKRGYIVSLPKWLHFDTASDFTFLREEVGSWPFIFTDELIYIIKITAFEARFP